MGKYNFDLPDLIGSILILLTPTGFASAIATMTSGRTVDVDPQTGSGSRTYRLLLTLTIFPLGVFVAFSLFRNIKTKFSGSPAVFEMPEAVRNTTGGQLFGKNSVMYRYWHPPETLSNRTILFITDDRKDMQDARVILLTKPTPESFCKRSLPTSSCSQAYCQ